MRIIAGSAGGRRLRAPKGQNTRPTTDRVREAVFSVLADRLAGARVLDAFAGSGAMGLEALSRGAAAAVFLEKDPAAQRVIAANIQAAALPGATLYRGAAERLLPRLKTGGAVEDFDIIFLDPPYNQGWLEKLLQIIETWRLLAPDGVLVVETSGKNSEFAPTDRWQILKRRAYGDTEIYYCGWRTDEK
ncbi:MAG: 16S rRNA (guanine(966)-N(2))-methyltransferase RsmD [Firmicutes bacterium]|nr:16S rRNA (guanine(966)-N(2))-methyltransferase RsmD [Bacillota bacterium]